MGLVSEAKDSMDLASLSIGWTQNASALGGLRMHRRQCLAALQGTRPIYFAPLHAGRLICKRLGCFGLFRSQRPSCVPYRTMA